ncbi:MAG TPA: TolC family protein [Opitutus sp.]|nr:TolC family protein [Opitutus sp.]
MTGSTALAADAVPSADAAVADAAPAISGPTLTLDDAIRLALEKNQQIKVDAYGRSIARADLLAALGKFDPSLNFRRSFSESNAPYSANPIVGQIVQTDDYSLSLDGTTPWGLNFSLGGSATNQRGTFINNNLDAYATFGGITVTQPLLRGFGFGSNFLGVRIAKADRNIADWQFRQTAIDTVTNVIVAYSNLAFAQESLAIAKRSRELAAGLVAENEKRFKVGSMSRSDVTQARARMATRDESILSAQQGVRDATNGLRALIGETEFPVVPGALNLQVPETHDLTPEPARDLQTALNLRPDYQAARLGLVKDRANDSAARNALLPQVDFVGSYGYDGLDRDFSVARQMVRDRAHRSYSAGVVVSVPLTFAAGRGRARSARLQLRRDQADLGRLERDIAVRVASAAGQIDTTRQRVAADLTAYNLAKQALDDEEKKLRAAASSTFFVLQLQENLAFAELGYEAALADQRRALATYDQVLGRTLLVRPISLDM